MVARQKMMRWRFHIWKGCSPVPPRRTVCAAMDTMGVHFADESALEQMTHFIYTYRTIISIRRVKWLLQNNESKFTVPVSLY